MEAKIWLRSKIFSMLILKDVEKANILLCTYLGVYTLFCMIPFIYKWCNIIYYNIITDMTWGICGLCHIYRHPCKAGNGINEEHKNATCASVLVNYSKAHQWGSEQFPSRGNKGWRNTEANTQVTSHKCELKVLQQSLPCMHCVCQGPRTSLSLWVLLEGI